jgi:hypothetical protein
MNKQFLRFVNRQANREVISPRAFALFGLLIILMLLGYAASATPTYAPLPPSCDSKYEPQMTSAQCAGFVDTIMTAMVADKHECAQIADIWFDRSIHLTRIDCYSRASLARIRAGTDLAIEPLLTYAVYGGGKYGNGRAWLITVDSNDEWTLVRSLVTTAEAAQ